MAVLKLNNVTTLTESGGAITITPNTTASGNLTVTGDTTHNGNVTMATNKKVKQKGAFMQNSVHQSWVLGG